MAMCSDNVDIGQLLFIRIAVVVAVLAVIACSVHANRRDSATVGISDNQAEQINRNILGIK